MITQYRGLVHEMDEEIDNGPIIIQKRIPIESDDSLHTLYLKVTRIGPDLLIAAVNRLNMNSKYRIQNDSSQATYFGFPSREDSELFRIKGKSFL